MGGNPIAEENQASAYIDRDGHSDGDFPFWSQKSGNKMSADFGRNANEKLEWTHQEPLESHTHGLPGPD